MIALEVSINGEFAALAGRDDMSVLNAIINAVGVLGNESKGTVNEGENQKPDLFLHLGGMTSKKNNEKDEHLRWITHELLEIGDTITVKLVEVSEAEPPVKNEVVNETFKEESEREIFESAKHYYMENKHKYK